MIIHLFVFKIRIQETKTDSTLSNVKSKTEENKEKIKKSKIKKNFVSINNFVNESTSKQEGKRKSNNLKDHKSVKKIKNISVQL